MSDISTAWLKPYLEGKEREKMRLLYFTDTHLRGNTPQSRLDNLPETLKSKLEEVVKLAADLKVDYILHGGDFFDSPSPSLAVSGDLLECFRQFSCPVYAISGNHDLFGGNIHSLNRTLLGFLHRLGFIRLVLPGEKIYLKKHDTVLQLTGQPYHYEIDQRDPHLDYAVKKENADLALHMVHGMLLERPLPKEANFTLIDRIKDTEADITLCGHYHSGLGIIEKEGKIFANPGALVRLSNDKQEMTRRVGVILVKLEGEKPVCEFIPLISARPGNEVLTREEIEHRSDLRIKLANFIKEVRQNAEFERMNARRIIEEIARGEAIDKEAKEEALKRIAWVEEELRSKRVREIR
ncbi:DNA repair exonuclease SbcCD nuclease subunit [Thermosyntropha lipolytica DSM 11003]|uniref:DNA repair exonuclease SbcCD nuclease subunit n=1 Tax=Thermosyntropha lipolytica DSM 11003 TaxID=1123382 RepID=A0A1M5PFH6_9FIRM|nr:metallophosphoesterase [Thermosyntropha lipolytica]SHH00013.1 DNA repair exonuclease SbcCD nuclease subunit [Thermosyntropha lipolytica DSM 11003]